MKNFRKELKNTKSGITLIALVITIVVLLILAGVSIASLSGENGIIQQAENAQKQTKQAEEKEKIELAVADARIRNNGQQELVYSNLQTAINDQFANKAIVSSNSDGTFTVSFKDTLRDYNITSSGIEKSIDWNEAMLNAKAPESQDEERNNDIVGIGTDGKPVDMDLWEYTLLEDGTYALNSNEVVNNGKWATGYKGTFNNGRIQGCLPQYISNDNGKNYKPVTSLYDLFEACKDMNYPPKIPSTVNSMFGTFSGSGLIEMPYIPNGVINLNHTFYNCSSLQKVTYLPDSIEDMESAFAECGNIKEFLYLPNNVKHLGASFLNCTSLKVGPKIIPNSVIHMYRAFENCNNLENIPNEIPSSVKCMTSTFLRCSKLSGKIVINANVNGSTCDKHKMTDYNFCFGDAATEGNGIVVSGECSILNNIINTKSENSKISLK